VEKILTLDIKNLRLNFKGYEGIARVLDGVYIQGHKGERVGLVGETGCGKTVAMKSILGLIKSPPAIYETGEIWVNGKDILKISKKELMKLKGNEISMIFQDPLNSLNPVFTIGQQLFDIIRYGHKVKLTKREIREKARNILKLVRLPDPERILKNYPMQLSGGMRQRVLIAMALVNEPELLIADEPGTALDVTIQDQILELLKDLVLQKNICVLIITHNLGVIRGLANKVYIMYAGQVVEQGDTRDVFDNPQHPYTLGLMRSIPKLTGDIIGEGIPGTIPDYVNAPTGCRFHPRCKHKKDVCSEKRPVLKEIAPGHFVSCFLYEE